MKHFASNPSAVTGRSTIKKAAFAALLPAAALATPQSAIGASTGTESLVHSFKCEDPSSPQGGMAMDAAGNVYAAVHDGDPDQWFVAQVNPAGDVSLLAPLGNTSQVDDAHVTVVAHDGNAIGFINGGASKLFKTTADGQTNILHAFAGQDGFNINIAVKGQDGFIYGADFTGGMKGMGILFRVAQDGSGFTVLHNFSPSEGQPLSLVQAADGSWYGTAGHITTENPVIPGLIFHFDAASRRFTPLHSTPNGTNPETLAIGQDGRLYGAVTTYGGTVHPTQIFSLAVDGSDFRQGPDIPASSSSFFGGIGQMELVPSADGRLFGLSEFGGSLAIGAIYQIGPTLTARQVFAFKGGPYGSSRASTTASQPEAMMLGVDGNFHGIAAGGGAGNGKGDACGAVFEYQPPVN